MIGICAAAVATVVSVLLCLLPLLCAVVPISSVDASIVTALSTMYRIVNNVLKLAMESKTSNYIQLLSPITSNY
jgi:hypothetical protein